MVKKILELNKKINKVSQANKPYCILECVDKDNARLIISCFNGEDKVLIEGKKYELEYKVNGQYNNFVKADPCEESSVVEEAMEMAKQETESFSKTKSNSSAKIKVISCLINEYEEAHNEFSKIHKVFATQTHVIEGEDIPVMVGVLFYD